MNPRAMDGVVELGIPRIVFTKITKRKTNMNMEKQQLEDASPIRNDDFPMPC